MAKAKKYPKTILYTVIGTSKMANDASLYNSSKGGNSVGKISVGTMFYGLQEGKTKFVKIYDLYESATNEFEYINKFVHINNIVVVSDKNIDEKIKLLEFQKPINEEGDEADSGLTAGIKDAGIVYTYNGKIENGSSYNPKMMVPSPTSSSLAVGEEVTVTLVTSDDTYSYITTKSGKKYFVKSSILKTEPTDMDVAAMKAQAHANTQYLSNAKNDIQDIMQNKIGARNISESSKKIVAASLRSILGAPYQFLPWVDCRLDRITSKSSEKDIVSTTTNLRGIGSIYGEKILTNMPLVFISPGEPDFLPSYSKKEIKNILSGLNDIVKGSESKLNDILKKTGTYYTFKYNYTDFYKYLNDYLHQQAFYLGIQDYEHAFYNNKGQIEHAKLSKIDWSKTGNSAVTGYTSPKEYICFYADAQTTVTNSFSNSVGESMFANSFDYFQTIAQEVQFLAGPIAGLKIQAADPEHFNATVKDIKKLASDMTGNSKLFGNLAEMFSTVSKGGKLIFPNIWKDASFDHTSIQIEQKLRCPCPDKVSWFLDIAVPLAYWYCLTMPRATGPNGFRAPFINRGFQKGVYSWNMGIITSLTASIGREECWTKDGLPTEVDVSVTIQDLYDTLSMTSTEKDGIGEFMQNTNYMNFLASAVGVNINKLDMSSIVQNYMILSGNQFTNKFVNRWRDIENDISNIGLKLYDTLIRKA